MRNDERPVSQCFVPNLVWLRDVCDSLERIPRAGGGAFHWAALGPTWGGRVVFCSCWHPSRPQGRWTGIGDVTMREKGISDDVSKTWPRLWWAKMRRNICNSWQWRNEWCHREKDNLHKRKKKLKMFCSLWNIVKTTAVSLQRGVSIYYENSKGSQ